MNIYSDFDTIMDMIAWNIGMDKDKLRDDYLSKFVEDLPTGKFITLVTSIVNIGINGDQPFMTFDEIIRKLSTTNKSLSNRKSDNWESSNDLSFPFEAIGPYYSLMKSLLRLLESKGDSTNISINTSTLDHTLTMTKYLSMPVGALFYELAPKYALEQKNLYELYISPTK